VTVAPYMRFLLLFLFFLIPLFSNAQSTDPFTIPSLRTVQYSQGNFTGYSIAFASTTGVVYQGRSGGLSNYHGFWFPTATTSTGIATTTITFTVTDYQQSGGVSCQFALGWFVPATASYPWSPAPRLQGRTILNVSATGTYSIVAPNNYSTHTAIGVGLWHSSSGTGISYCEIIITDWTITKNGVTLPVFDLVTVPVTIGGGSSNDSSMSTTTIMYYDGFLFSIGIFLFLFAIAIWFMIIKRNRI